MKPPSYEFKINIKNLNQNETYLAYLWLSVCTLRSCFIPGVTIAGCEASECGDRPGWGGIKPGENL